MANKNNTKQSEDKDKKVASGEHKNDSSKRDSKDLSDDDTKKKSVNKKANK